MKRLLVDELRLDWRTDGLIDDWMDRWRSTDKLLDVSKNDPMDKNYLNDAD